MGKLLANKEGGKNKPSKMKQIVKKRIKWVGSCCSHREKSYLKSLLQAFDEANIPVHKGRSFSAYWALKTFFIKSFDEKYVGEVRRRCTSEILGRSAAFLAGCPNRPALFSLEKKSSRDGMWQRRETSSGPWETQRARTVFHHTGYRLSCEIIRH